MNLTEYRNQVDRAARIMAEIVKTTDIKTYGHFFQAWYNHLWHSFKDREAGTTEPMLNGGMELKDTWDRFIEAWDAGCSAADEDEEYYESFIVDVFYQIKLKNLVTDTSKCNCGNWDGDSETADIFGLVRTNELVDLSHDHRSIFECQKCGQAYLWKWHESSWLSGEEVTMTFNSITNIQKQYFVQLSGMSNISDQDIEELIHEELTKDLHD